MIFHAMIKEDNWSFQDWSLPLSPSHHNAEQKGESLSKEDLSASFQAAHGYSMAKTKKALENTLLKPSRGRWRG